MRGTKLLNKKLQVFVCPRRSANTADFPYEIRLYAAAKAGLTCTDCRSYSCQVPDLSPRTCVAEGTP
jgi:hypothetical protein